MFLFTLPKLRYKEEIAIFEQDNKKKLAFLLSNRFYSPLRTQNINTTLNQKSCMHRKRTPTLSTTTKMEARAALLALSETDITAQWLKTVQDPEVACLLLQAEVATVIPVSFLSDFSAARQSSLTSLDLSAESVDSNRGLLSYGLHFIDKHQPFWVDPCYGNWEHIPRWMQFFAHTGLNTVQQCQENSGQLSFWLQC